jgi:hypothetical protein
MKAITSAVEKVSRAKKIASGFCIIIATLGYMSCQQTTPVLDTLPAPTFSIATGTYPADQTVAITCSNAGATVYYTLDGTDPSSTSTVYSTPIAVTGHNTVKNIKAIAAGSGWNSSSIASITVTILDFPRIRRHLNADF